jgi:anti-sigma factor RsiW
MNCSRDLIEAYVDEEIDASQRAAFEDHLPICPECSRIYGWLMRQKAAVRGAVPYYEAPSALHDSVRAALGRLALENSRPAPRPVPWRALAIAASVLLVFSLSWNVLLLQPRRAATDLAGTVFADHIRSLAGPGLVDVATSDQHTVKPWFAGKLDFSPVVKDLGAQGFLLAGGRIDYLADRRVAALVYHRRGHVINLFTWPVKSSSVAGFAISRNGYNLIEWTGGAMVYWAVSDVSAADLKDFRSLFQSRDR